MFTFGRKKSHDLANDHGYNDAWLGIPNSNPYPVGSLSHREYNFGFDEGEDLVDEFTKVNYATTHVIFPDVDNDYI